MALAQSSPDYKALVCVFQQGGNDGENTLVRSDTRGYQAYAAVRTNASGLNIPQAQLLPIQPLRGGPPYGFHPSCQPLQHCSSRRSSRSSPTSECWCGRRPGSGSRRRAPRGRPICSRTRTRSSRCRAASHTASSASAGEGGSPIAGGRESRHAVPTTGLDQRLAHVRIGRTLGAAHRAEQPVLHAYGSGERPTGQYDALRDAALREMLAQSRANIFDVVAQLYAEEGLAASSVVFPDHAEHERRWSRRFSPPSIPSIARQLRTIAQLIEGRAQTQMRRQIFYVQQWGYDTHGSQAGIHTAIARRFIRVDEGVPGRHGSARTRQQRDHVLDVRIRPHVQAGQQPGHRPRLGQLRLRDGRSGERRRLLRHSSRRSRSMVPTTSARTGGGFPPPRSTSMGRRYAAGSGLPKATCPTSSRTSARSRTRNLGFMA